MKFTIKDLEKQWINKSLLYKALKNSFLFSDERVKNKRVFNNDDLKILKQFKELWEKEILKIYWNNSIESKKTVSEKQLKGFWIKRGNLETVFNEGFNKENKTVSEQQKLFETVKTELNKKIEQQNKIIETKDNQTQSMAIRLRDEKKEKDEWIKKYDKVLDKKEEVMKKYYNIKSYLIIFIVLFILVLIVLFLVVGKFIDFNF